MIRSITTFEEHIELLATESPHVLILDWWRRLSLAIDEYLKARGLSVKSTAMFKEEILAADPHLGPEVAAHIRELRLSRNAIAHEKPKPIPPDEAAQYARQALDYIWLLGERIDQLDLKSRM